MRSQRRRPAQSGDGQPGTEVRIHGGAEGTRTPDPLHAMEVRYQLRHSPARPQAGAAPSIPGADASAHQTPAPGSREHPGRRSALARSTARRRPDVVLRQRPARPPAALQHRPVGVAQPAEGAPRGQAGRSSRRSIAAAQRARRARRRRASPPSGTARRAARRPRRCAGRRRCASRPPPDRRRPRRDARPRAPRASAARSRVGAGPATAPASTSRRRGSGSTSRPVTRGQRRGGVARPAAGRRTTTASRAARRRARRAAAAAWAAPDVVELRCRAGPGTGSSALHAVRPWRQSTTRRPARHRPTGVAGAASRAAAVARLAAASMTGQSFHSRSSA